LQLEHVREGLCSGLTVTFQFIIAAVFWHTFVREL